MSANVQRQMAIGERKFIKRTQVVLVEVVANDTNNVNDARDRLVNETVLAESVVDVPHRFVSTAIHRVTSGNEVFA